MCEIQRNSHVYTWVSCLGVLSFVYGNIPKYREILDTLALTFKWGVTLEMCVRVSGPGLTA